MEQNDKVFSEQKTKKDSGMLKKVVIVLTMIAVVIFVIMSNCHDKKKEVKKVGVVNSKTDSSIVEDIFEKDLKEKRNVASEEEWKKDSSGLIQTLAANQSNGNPTYDPSYARPQIASDPSQNYSPNFGASQNNDPVRPTVSSAPYKYTAPSAMKKRVDPEYQMIVDHFKGVKKYAWSITDDEFENMQSKKGDLLNPVEKPLKDLYSGANTIKSTFATKLPAGTRIIAVTDQDISSDHPGMFTASIVRPFEAKGYKLVCQSGNCQKDRIPVTIVKVVNSANEEVAMDGQVQMGFPGLEGRVKNHWPQRVVPSLVSAAIGGGASLYLLNSSTPNSGSTTGGNISTRDLIAGPLLEGATQSLQNEVTRFGGDYPNTVTVKQGTQFEILVTSEVKL